jgi:predicted nucleic acid-binding protein
MILVDTSIWVEMFRRGRFKAELATLIGNDQLCTHPFVVAELACGYLPQRQQTLLEFDKLTALPTIRTADVRYMLETRGLFRKASASSMPNSLPRASPRMARTSGPSTGLSAKLRNPSAFAQLHNILEPCAEL